MSTHNLQKLAARRDRSIIDYMRASPEERRHMDMVNREMEQRQNEAFKNRLNALKDKSVNLYNGLVGKNS